MRKARMAIGRGQVVCVPSDTVYSLVANAFTATAVHALRAIREMEPSAPLSVFLPGLPTLHALAETVAEEVQALANEFWPGPLTIIVPAAESLSWDLGETSGTVALRMPADRIVLELLSETGPLVCSSASVAQKPGALSALAAHEIFGDAVSVYLAGEVISGSAGLSTVIDATGLDKPANKLRVVREGAIPLTDIYQVVPEERFV
jgi:tRNA threonylcarbamoyl adenosine modification protein (Sua5/YciO/YrdC/YwlC family)